MITVLLIAISESNSILSEEHFSSELEFKNWLLDNGYSRYAAHGCTEHDVYYKEVTGIERWVVGKQSKE